MPKKINNNEMFGGNLTDLPNDKYAKFFATFNEITQLDVEQWKPSHILGYFVKKYKDVYKIDYKFKFNSPSPNKCFEIFQIKKLAMLLTSQPALLKDYIDWVFENKVVKAKRRLTSISFMTNEGIINDYKNNVLLGDSNTIINRSTLLPGKYKSIFANIGLTINTYGDLSFISQMDSLSTELKNAFIEIERLGFDNTLLGRIV
jgi:hypothetical protein